MRLRWICRQWLRTIGPIAWGRAVLCAGLLCGAVGASAAEADSDEGLSPKPLRVTPHQLLVRFRPGVGAVRQQAVLGGGSPRVKSFRWLGPKGRPVTVQSVRAGGSSVFEQLAVVELEEGTDVGDAMHTQVATARATPIPNPRPTPKVSASVSAQPAAAANGSTR